MRRRRRRRRRRRTDTEPNTRTPHNDVGKNNICHVIVCVLAMKTLVESACMSIGCDVGSISIKACHDKHISAPRNFKHCKPSPRLFCTTDRSTEAFHAANWFSLPSPSKKTLKVFPPESHLVRQPVDEAKNSFVCSKTDSAPQLPRQAKTCSAHV